MQIRRIEDFDVLAGLRLHASLGGDDGINPLPACVERHIGGVRSGMFVGPIDVGGIAGAVQSPDSNHKRADFPAVEAGECALNQDVRADDNCIVAGVVDSDGWGGEVVGKIDFEGGGVGVGVDYGDGVGVGAVVEVGCGQGPGAGGGVVGGGGELAVDDGCNGRDGGVGLDGKFQHGVGAEGVAVLGWVYGGDGW